MARSFVFLAAILLFANQSFSAQISSKFKLDQLNKHLVSLQKLGIDQFNNNVPYEESCSKIKGFEKTYCIDGYLTQYYMKMSNTEFKKNITNIPSPHHAHVFGIVSYLKSIPVTFSYLSPNSLFSKIIVDGWATGFSFTHTSKNKKLNLLSEKNLFQQTCQDNFPKTHHEYCLWGMGRGYFWGSSDRILESGPKLILQGNHFTYYLADPNSVVEFPQIKESAEMIRTLIEVNGSKILSNSFSCLTNNHLVDCLRKSRKDKSKGPSKLFKVY